MFRWPDILPGDVANGDTGVVVHISGQQFDQEVIFTAHHMTGLHLEDGEDLFRELFAIRVATALEAKEGAQSEPEHRGIEHRPIAQDIAGFLQLAHSAQAGSR